jgi:glycine amidinotransferase
MNNHNQCKVHVYTEWGQLEEVIFGNSLNFNLKDIDFTFRFLYENKDGRFREKTQVYELSEQYVMERQEDLDNLQRILEDFGVVVQRPQQLREITKFRTPTFEAYMTACDSVRDPFFLIGDEIIETPPTNRKRYFENFLVRDIFMDYFRSGAKWTVAPRTTLAEEHLDFSFWQDTVYDPLNALDNIEEKYEIAFDAANCLKFGRDIVMNVGTKNHELGAMWLQRHLGDQFRVHPVRLCDSHIDGNFLPLAPGKLLVNPRRMHEKYDLLPEPLKKWDMIMLEDRDLKFDYPSTHLQIASTAGMVVNALSIDEKHVLIRDNAPLTRKALERAGFEPIPIQLRHCEIFAGGIHCATVDVRRKEDLEEYFN